MCLTNAAVHQPRPPFDDDEDRRLSEHCGMKAAKPPWELGHPPQQTARAGRVPGVVTLLLFALATASRLPCEQDATGTAPVGWQRWRRPLLEHTRTKVLILAQGSDGIVHLTDYSWLMGVRRKDVPPGLGTLQDILAQ